MLIDLTLAENIALAIVGTDRRKWVFTRPLSAFPAIREQALAGLAAVGLKDRADDPVKLLSYGERRQLELALALNNRPKVLFLDEPCAGLSPSERQRIFRKLDMPRAITPTHYLTFGVDPNLDDAAKQALRDMIRWLVEIKGWSSEEAYVFCSLACDLRVTQLVDGNKGIHAMVDRSLIE